MPAIRHPAAFSRVSHLAEQRSVHQAFQWLHLHEPRIMRWQAEMVSIPAPPFGEGARAQWLLHRFRELGLTQVRTDAAGNALALYSASGDRDPNSSRSSILLSAHIDTVFPLATPIYPVQSEQRLTAPGACDNGAGVVALLAIAAALRHADIEISCDLLFAGNVGEEGEGDLRGIRHIYEQAAPHIASHVVLDGAGNELVVTGAVGSRRYRVTIDGSGGHSWSDAGRPNPIVVMSRAIAQLSELELCRNQTTNEAKDGVGQAGDKPARQTQGDTRWNVGTIEGGTSVNSIPQTASARFDMRSTDPDQLIWLEVELYRAFEDALLAATAAAPPAPKAPGFSLWSPANQPRGTEANQLRLIIEKIGDRPAGHLPPDAPILETLRAVDRHLGIRTEERIASTDANIPLSLGLQAVSIGAGGDGGGTHTSNEWYDARNRDLALRRILLLVLALATPA